MERGEKINYRYGGGKSVGPQAIGPRNFLSIRKYFPKKIFQKIFKYYKFFVCVLMLCTQVNIMFLMLLLSVYPHRAG